MSKLVMNKHILYGGDSLKEGNIGLHLTDWSGFDKIVCGLALKDSLGNVIFGYEPTAKEGLANQIYFYIICC